MLMKYATLYFALLVVHASPFPLEPVFIIYFSLQVAPVAQRYHVTSDTLGREFDPGKRDFSH